MEIINTINEKTKDLEGMKVPVEIHIDSDKSFTIEVGSPQTSALIKKELGIKKAVGSVKSEVSGSLSFDQVLKIAKSKYDQLIARSKKSAVLEVLGTCRSMGVNVDNKPPQVTIDNIKAGKLDSKLKD
jgi:large subunit ribosomal protein L11